MKLLQKHIQICCGLFQPAGREGSSQADACLYIPKIRHLHRRMDPPARDRDPSRQHSVMGNMHGACIRPSSRHEIRLGRDPMAGSQLLKPLYHSSEIIAKTYTDLLRAIPACWTRRQQPGGCMPLHPQDPPSPPENGSPGTGSRSLPPALRHGKYAWGLHPSLQQT